MDSPRSVLGTQTNHHKSSFDDTESEETCFRPVGLPREWLPSGATLATPRVVIFVRLQALRAMQLHRSGLSHSRKGLPANCSRRHVRCVPAQLAGYPNSNDAHRPVEGVVWAALSGRAELTWLILTGLLCGFFVFSEPTRLNVMQVCWSHGKPAPRCECAV